MFTLAHLSDVHLAPLPEPTLPDLCGKRLLGYLSWRANRHGIHERLIADRLRDDISGIAPDHVALTGDMVNIALAGEFGQAAGWLKSFGAPEWISLVPGNHDAYVPMDFAGNIGQWAGYMTGDGAGAKPKTLDGHFPYLRRRGEVAIIGVSSAVATIPFSAAGRIGDGQLARLDALLERLAGEAPELARVILIHHPPLAGLNSRRKGLADAGRFEALLSAHGAELVLHGHNHKPMENWFDGATGPVPVLGVAAASTGAVHGPRPLAQYHLLRISKPARAFQIDITVRGIESPDGAVKSLRTHRLKPPSP